MATEMKKSRSNSGVARTAVQQLATINPVLGLLASAAAPGVMARAADTKVARAPGKRPGETSVAIAPPTQPSPDQFITPYDRQAAWVDQLLRQPRTMYELQAVTGMLPAKGKAQTAQDAARAQAAETSAAIASATIAQAKDNPSYNEEQRNKIITDAMKTRMDQLIAIAGGNPMNLLGTAAPTEDE